MLLPALSSHRSAPSGLPVSTRLQFQNHHAVGGTVKVKPGLTPVSVVVTGTTLRGGFDTVVTFNDMTRTYSWAIMQSRQFLVRNMDFAVCHLAANFQ